VSFWTAIVVIVAIASYAAIRIERIRSRDRLSHGERSRSPAREAELEREVLDLKKRLAVLERIATDDRQSKAIAHEIEALRDR
jgi:dephospho-CoA kinase